MNKNIINLSKIFIKESLSNFDIIKDKKINKKSSMFWILLIIFLGVSWLSYEIIYNLVGVGKTEIFLNGYILFLQVLFLMQGIMVCTNIFYFSKDIENILPMPFKPYELLVAKFNTLLSMLYGTEFIFGLIPLIIYGIYANVGIIYFINLAIMLIAFPIFWALVISVIMMLIMNILKVIKNRDLMQIIVSTVLILLIIFFLNFEFKNVFENREVEKTETEQIQVLDDFNNKIIEINKYFLIINPISGILKNNSVILNYFKIIIFNTSAFCIFILLGKKIYLKQLLKNSFYVKNKISSNIDLNRKCKKSNFSYIKKEIKLLIKNPIFFMQCIYPIILSTIMCAVLIFGFVPKVRELFSMEEYKEHLQNLKFDFEAVCIMLGLTQIIGLLNYSSVTAFSREGKDAWVIKNIPISLYKQFVCKCIPQIILNTISSGIILGVISYQIPEIEIKYILVIYGLSILMTCINSFILSLIDLINPKINWDAEYEILKNNKNKLLQYVLIILNILFLIYFEKLLIKIKFKFAILILAVILLFIFIILNIIINKFKNKLYKKIF